MKLLTTKLKSKMNNIKSIIIITILAISNVYCADCSIPQFPDQYCGTDDFENCAFTSPSDVCPFQPDSVRCDSPGGNVTARIATKIDWECVSTTDPNNCCTLVSSSPCYQKQLYQCVQTLVSQCEFLGSTRYVYSCSQNKVGGPEDDGGNYIGHNLDC